jgi:hypothetical protein
LQVDRAGLLEGLPKLCQSFNGTALLEVDATEDMVELLKQDNAPLDDACMRAGLW